MGLRLSQGGTWVHAPFQAPLGHIDPGPGHLAQGHQEVRIGLKSLLVACGRLLKVLLAIPLGILGAIYHGRWPDSLARFIALIGTSVPVFWLGLLALYVFFDALAKLGEPKGKPQDGAATTKDPALWTNEDINTHLSRM